MSIEKPIKPFMRMDAGMYQLCTIVLEVRIDVPIIAHGTTRDELRISSLMCTAQSAPENAKSGVMSPTKKLTPLLSYPPPFKNRLQTSSLLPLVGDMTVTTVRTMIKRVICRKRMEVSTCGSSFER
jgi:hypothetical protein